MFEHLGQYEVILVTGPQRSGTRICAKMIAHDTGHRFVDELEIHTDSVYELMQVIHFQRKEPVVVQCPALCHIMEIAFGGKNTFWSNVAVVLVRRKLEDICASELRVEWGWHQVEGWNYGIRYPTGNIAEVKYKYWDAEQKKYLYDRAYEVEYESLKEHPLWVDKEHRQGFGALQTQVS